MIGYGTEFEPFGFLMDEYDVPVRTETGPEEPSVGTGPALEFDIG